MTRRVLGLAAAAWLACPGQVFAAVSPDIDGKAWPYGVSVLPEQTPQELASDAALGQVNRFRLELARRGALSESSLAEAGNLLYFGSVFLAPRDKAFLGSAVSLKFKAVKISGLGLAAEIPATPMFNLDELAALAQQDYHVWLAGLRQEAAGQGIPKPVLDAALTGLTTSQAVLDLENSQPEHTITFEQYIDKVVASRVERGRQKFAEYRVQLQAVSARYGVPPEVITALWGIETKYGLYMGDFPIIRSLATLAYAGKRPSFFRKELFEALWILAEEGMSSKDLKGSWAGAMGQCQFMPSSFRRLAADGDGDGKRDIWKSEMDVFASAGNYLSKAGWRKAAGWGQEVWLPDSFDQAQADLKVVKPISAWRQMGVEPVDGAALPDGGVDASIIRPSGPGGRAFLVLQNFRVFMSWNRSTYFATAAGLLSERIAGP
ncbi:MAG: lytic murein transglycosylase [Elusimicrobia bacterium]|nr:lytic murein transglycosylase [Elusimicrobiota bacterium]